ncbi:MAG: hypothetical protein KGQ59_05335 [Bdellovibrionales bacterium]|nr:hypothetical protein [Bdellovibrionales bacterium]
MKRLLILVTGVLLVAATQADTESNSPAVQSAQNSDGKSAVTQATQVKYRSGKELRFDELLIQGQMKRAEMSVVTGDPSELSDGLLRLRENFLDHSAYDLGEEVQ